MSIFVFPKENNNNNKTNIIHQIAMFILINVRVLSSYICIHQFVTLYIFRT